MKDISIIIISYNTVRLTLECLASVEAAHGDKEVFVVDNASSDDTIYAIRKQFPDVQLIANTGNRGFARANNQALPLCRGRYIVYLNPDTTIKPDTLIAAVSFMDASPSVGMAGAKILNPDGSLQESVSYRYPGEKHTCGETSRLAGKISCVLGAFMIARRDLINRLGGFDEDFFLYGEDQDLAWRIRETGFTIGYIEDADVFHWGAQSEAATPSDALFAKKLRAEYLFYSKHYQLQTIAKIKRAQKLKAWYRLLTLKLTTPFGSNRATLQNKINCYRIALKMAENRE